MSVSFDYEPISSRKNSRIANAASLSEKKYRDEKGLFAVEGVKLLCELTETGLNPESVFFTEKAMKFNGELLQSAAEGGAKMFLVTEEVAEKLSEEKAPQGIYACASLPVRRAFDPLQNYADGCLILDSIQDPGNIGTVIRTAVSLGLSDIVLAGECADLYSRKSLRASMGAIFRARVTYAESCTAAVRSLKENGKRVYAAALTASSSSIGDISFRRDDIIVIGNEGHGLTEETVFECTDTVIIPMHSGMDSLNAGAAATIFIWEKQKAERK